MCDVSPPRVGDAREPSRGPSTAEERENRDARVRPLVPPPSRRVAGERMRIASAVAQHPHAAPLPFCRRRRDDARTSRCLQRARLWSAPLRRETTAMSRPRPQCSFSGTSTDLRQTNRVPQFPSVRRFWKDGSCSLIV